MAMYERVTEREPLIPPDQEGFLGSELCRALNDLAEISADLEELLQNELMSLPELLEYMEMVGVLDMTRIKAVNHALDAKKADILKKLAHINEEIKKTKKLNERFLIPFGDFIETLKRGRPLFSFLLNQSLSNNLLEGFKIRLTQLERIRANLNSIDPFAAEKSHWAQVKRNGVETIINLDSLIWLFAKIRTTSSMLVETDTEEAEKWYLENKYAKIHGDRLAVKTQEGGLLREVGVAARFKPTEEVNAGEAFQLAMFAIVFSTDGGGARFLGTISRIDGELYLPNSITGSLKEFLEGRNLGWLYKHIKREVYATLIENIASGDLSLEHQPLVELPGSSRVLQQQGGSKERVAEAVLPELALDTPGAFDFETQEAEKVDQISAPEGGLKVDLSAHLAETRRPKGVRQKLSGLEAWEIIATLKKLGVDVDEAKRGHHIILRKGPTTYPFPSEHGQGKATGNLARILTRALSKFGITRNEFLSAY